MMFLLHTVDSVLILRAAGSLEEETVFESPLILRYAKQCSAAVDQTASWGTGVAHDGPWYMTFSVEVSSIVGKREEEEGLDSDTMV